MRPLLPVLLCAVFATATAAVPQPRLDEVAALARERRLADAHAAATKLTAEFPREAAAHAALGGVLSAQQQYDAAIASFERAVELAPRDGGFLAQLGMAQLNQAGRLGMSFKAMGLAKKGRTALEKAVELDPANLGARSALLGFYQNAPGIAGGSMDKAYAQAAEIKKLDADRGRLAFAQLYAADKKFAQAFAEFEDVLRADPDNYLANYQIGRLAALSGDRIDRGVETLRKALALPPTPNAAGHEAAHWRLGMLLERKGDKAAARAAYEASLQLNPKFQQAADALKKLTSG